MRTILVPVDFSELSKAAARYAIGMADKMKARIILLSVINANPSSRVLSNWKDLRASLVKTDQKEADQFMQEIKSEIGKIKISHRIVLGYPIVKMINQFAETHDVSLIIMGTKGATGLKRLLVGSHTTEMINTSKVPVMVIPENTRFKSIKKLVYATDMKNLKKELLTVAEFARLHEAHIHVLHVIPEDAARMKNIEMEGDLKSSEEELIRKANYPEITLHLVGNKNAGVTVDRFVNQVKADVLLMFTHRADFIERLYGKSVTRSLAFHNRVPMLTFNRSNY